MTKQTWREKCLAEMGAVGPAPRADRVARPDSRVEGQVAADAAGDDAADGGVLIGSTGCRARALDLTVPAMIFEVRVACSASIARLGHAAKP